MRIGISLAWLNDGSKSNWIGDMDVALAWQKYLRRAGQYCEIIEPGSTAWGLDVCIHFHYMTPTQPCKKNLHYMQNSWPRSEQWPEGNFGVYKSVKDKFNGFLFASEGMKQACGGEGAVIPFACDPERMRYEYDVRYAHPVVFVGNDIVDDEVNERYLVPALPYGLVIYGGPYKNSKLQACHRGKLPDSDLHKVYSSSKIVLNRTHPQHREFGLINERIYNILACGGTVLSDYVQEAKNGFGGFVQFTNGGSHMNLMIQHLIQEHGQMDKDDLLGDEQVKRSKEVFVRHSYSHRVETLMAYLREVV